jgi:uncharacterized protein (TIGR02118 family)
MVKLVYIVKRRDDVSPAEFHRYWLEKHGPLVRSFAKVLNARKYVQSHTIEPERNVALAATRGMPAAFDGITEVWFDSLDSLNGLNTAEARAADRALIEDESKFVDLKRSYAFLTEEHTIFDL